MSLVLTPSKPDPETEAAIKAAESLFQQGKLAEAEQAFARLDHVKLAGKTTTAKVDAADPAFEVKDESKGLWARVKSGKLTGNQARPMVPWGEKVLFYLAECQYQQGKFVAANDNYERLLNAYPGSPHLEKAVEREFAIANDWLALNVEKPLTEKGKGAPVDDSVRQASWTDHFSGRKPLVDVDGYAVKVLEHVRQHDATGPLADDAVLTIAEHYMRREDYENASVHFDQMINDYPKSPLLQKAMLGSIDAKMKDYLGPEYDSEGLERARKLIRQVQMIFPERNDELNKMLQHNLDLIADQQAAIAFKNGEFYKRTGYVSGAELAFGEVRARWPKSEWAAKAKIELASLSTMKRKEVAPSKILTLPGAPDPQAGGTSSSGGGNGGGAMGGMGGMPGSSGP